MFRLMFDKFLMVNLFLVYVFVIVFSIICIKVFGFMCGVEIGNFWFVIFWFLKFSIRIEMIL